MPRYYITADIAREAAVYHTDPDCSTLNHSDATATEVVESTVRRHGLDECEQCAGTATLTGSRRALLEMNPSDVSLDGGSV